MDFQWAYVRALSGKTSGTASLFYDCMYGFKKCNYGDRQSHDMVNIKSQFTRRITPYIRPKEVVKCIKKWSLGIHGKTWLSKCLSSFLYWAKTRYYLCLQSVNEDDGRWWADCCGCNLLYKSRSETFLLPGMQSAQEVLILQTSQWSFSSCRMELIIPGAPVWI